MDFTALTERYEKKRVYTASAKKPYQSTTMSKAAPIAAAALVAPTIAMAADTFGDIHNTVMGIFDSGVVIVIIFAGAAWALGHRSKAIELLVGVCCGYLLARHAIDIRDYLKNIGA